MDNESELQLYDHVDFLGSTPCTEATADTKSLNDPNGPFQRKSKKRKQLAGNTIQRRGNPKKGNMFINTEHSGQRLDPFELMFFPANYDPSPLRCQQLFGEDLHRKQNYLNKIKKMSHADKRKHRAERDLRYLHKNAETPADGQTEEELNDESNLFCVHHLTGKCNKATCKRVHQMRVPRLFGVCKFFLTKSCAKGEACEFMHSEFPCRYYYLDLEHPKGVNDGECKFAHGGPLNKEMNRYFKKHIEFWVKDTTSASVPDEFEKKLDDFIERFELKQIKLEEELKRDKKKTIMIPKHSDKLTWESILAGNQLETLERRGIDSVEKINRTPVDVLLECGLKMDQIYKITVNTCHEMRNSVQESIKADEHHDEILDYGNDPMAHSHAQSGKVTNETLHTITEKSSNENEPSHDHCESDAAKHQNNCDRFEDLLEDLEMSDDSDHFSNESDTENNLVINENENDNENEET